MTDWRADPVLEDACDEVLVLDLSVLTAHISVNAPKDIIDPYGEALFHSHALKYPFNSGGGCFLSC